MSYYRPTKETDCGFLIEDVSDLEKNDIDQCDNCGYEMQWDQIVCSPCQSYFDLRDAEEDSQ